VKWRRIFGVFLLLISLVLAVLLSVKVPIVKTTPLFNGSPIDVESEGLANNFYNATLEPVGMKDYMLIVSILPYTYNTTSINVDLWVVNQTSVYRLCLLTEILESGALNQSEESALSAEYYANQLPNVTAYAREMDITGGHGDLVNLNHNGTYCFVLVNLLQSSQTVSVNIEEQYIESYGTWLELSPVTITVTAAVLTAGVCLIVVSEKQSAREVKGRRKKT
jgi:hypothetical protein